MANSSPSSRDSDDSAEDMFREDACLVLEPGVYLALVFSFSLTHISPRCLVMRHAGTKALNLCTTTLACCVHVRAYDDSLTAPRSQSPVTLRQECLKRDNTWPARRPRPLTQLSVLG